MVSKPRICRCGEELPPKKRLCEACRAIPDPRCKKCKKVKPVSKFAYDKDRPDRHFPWCMDCQEKSGSFFQNENAPLNGNICPIDDVPIRGNKSRKYCSTTCQHKSNNLSKKFNLTPQQFRALVDSTGGICPLCLKQPTQWHIDHNHTTSQVMGVVCQSCNVGSLAMTFHDVSYVLRLLEFLENPPALALGIDAKANEAYHQTSNLHQVWNHNKSGYQRRRA